MESTLAGCASTLFSDTMEAAVYWMIIMPELTPGALDKKGGKPFDS